MKYDHFYDTKKNTENREKQGSHKNFLAGVWQLCPNSQMNDQTGLMLQFKILQDFMCNLDFFSFVPKSQVTKGT